MSVRILDKGYVIDLFHPIINYEVISVCQFKTDKFFCINKDKIKKKSVMQIAMSMTIVCGSN